MEIYYNMLLLVIVNTHRSFSLVVFVWASMAHLDDELCKRGHCAVIINRNILAVLF